MPDKNPPCAKCNGLVGAGPAGAAHDALVLLPKESGDEDDVFSCGDCGNRWFVGPLGWTRLTERYMAETGRMDGQEPPVSA
jgi:hypothetical protein